MYETNQDRRKRVSMIEDITKIGITSEFADKMIDRLGYNTVLNIACNYPLVKENMNLLKSFGIQNIEDLLLNRSDIFLKDYDLLVKRFSKFNIPLLIQLINEDYTAIDELFYE